MKNVDALKMLIRKIENKEINVTGIKDCYTSEISSYHSDSIFRKKEITISYDEFIINK